MANIVGADVALMGPGRFRGILLGGDYVLARL